MKHPLPPIGTIKGLALVKGEIKLKKNFIVYECMACGKQKKIQPDQWHKYSMNFCTLCIGATHTHFTHGQSSELTTEYMVWRNAKYRCNSSRSQASGPSLTMCERWFDSFSAFYEDMGPSPSPFYFFHRMDKKLGYFPSNCIWKKRKVPLEKKEKKNGKKT